MPFVVELLDAFPVTATELRAVSMHTVVVVDSLPCDCLLPPLGKFTLHI